MNKKGFTLIELMIVVAIIAIIAAIAIPSLLNARRTSNENSAMAGVKSFGTAAVDYSNTTPQNYYWRSGANAAADFAPYYSFVTPKGGYIFKYFSNSTDAATNNATRFAFLAYPVSSSSGRKAYIVDESQAIFEILPAAGSTADQMITGCAAATPDFTKENTHEDWFKPANSAITRK